MLKFVLALLIASQVGAFHAPAAERKPLLRGRARRLNLLDTADLTPPPEKVVAAVEGVYQRQPDGTRLTAADLAAEGGIGIDDARAGMRELATALAGADGLSVSASSQGDLLYTFPSDVRKELSARDNAAKAREAWNQAKPALQTVGRVSFGLALFASIAVIFTAITVLSQGEREERDERRGGGMFGGGGMGYFETRILLDVLFPPFPFGCVGARSSNNERRAITAVIGDRGHAGEIKLIKKTHSVAARGTARGW